MIDKIPHALLNTRIGGMSQAHETRKFCFLFEGPTFLQKVVREIGPLAGNNPVTADNLPFRESGKVVYDSQFLKMEMSEDPLRRNGLKLHYRVLDASGAQVLGGSSTLGRLNKDDALTELVHQIRAQLPASKASLH